MQRKGVDIIRKSKTYFLDNIKNIRKSRNITQREMADKLDISESFYCQIEGGQRRLTINHAIKISEVLEETLDSIFLSCNLAKEKGISK